MADPTRTAAPPDAPAVTHTLADGTATGGDAPTSSPVVLPTSAGRYLLGPEIARGGMGVVYRATDTTLGREVAVKVLSDKYPANSPTARRFADEARIAGQLQHPGIPPVHDLGTLPDGRPFLAMKLIKGDTLDALLDRRAEGRPEFGRWLAAFEKVCEAVAYAHAHAVIHRDLKPHNVMVGAFGEVQVMDWGLAKVLAPHPPDGGEADEPAAGTVVQSIRDSDGSFTQAGSVMGTPAFMPPEQAIGAVGKIDARSDVFGLGGILAVILTGRPPYTGADAEAVRLAAAQGAVAACHARLDGCGADPELVALGKRCLSAAQHDRPADAGEVAKAVAALRHAADERARVAEVEREKGEVRRVEERKRARVRRTLLLVATLAVGVAGGTLALVVKLVADRDRLEGEKNATELRQQLEDSRRAAADADREAADAAREAKAAQDRAAAAAVIKAAVEQMYRDLDAGRWQDARSSLARATDRLKGAADWPADLTAAAGQAEKDLEIATEFDTVRHSMADFSLPDGRFDNAARARVYQQAFARFGFTDWADADAVAGRVTASRIRAVLTDGLEQFSFTPDPVLNPSVRAILDKLHAGSEWRARRDAAVRTGQVGLIAVADDPDAYRQLPATIIGLAYSIRDRAKRVEVLRRGLAAHPLDYWLYSNLVDELSTGTRDERWDAVGYARTAAAIRPQSPRATLKLAQALAAVERPDEAVANGRRAVEQANGAGTTRAELALLLVRVGRPAEAEAEFRRAVLADPPSSFARDKFGHYLQDRGRNPEAVPLFREAAKLEEATCRYHPCLANALGIAGDHAAAAAVYGQFADKYPGDPSYRIQQASHLTRGGSPKLALPLAEAVTRAHPGNPYGWSQVGNARFALKEYPAAAAAYLRAAELAPTNRPVLAHVTPRLTAAGRPADAVALITKNLKQSADWLNQDEDHLLYNGACAAALASASAADPNERAALRLLARVWGRAYLRYWKKKLGGTPTDRRLLADDVAHWLADPDFRSVRPGVLRIGMPAAERAEWDALWAEAKVTLDEARKPVREVLPPPRKE